MYFWTHPWTWWWSFFVVLVLFLDRMAVTQPIVCWDDTTSPFTPTSDPCHGGRVGVVRSGNPRHRSPSTVHLRSHPYTSKATSMLSHTFGDWITVYHYPEIDRNLHAMGQKNKKQIEQPPPPQKKKTSHLTYLWCWPTAPKPLKQVFQNAITQNKLLALAFVRQYFTARRRLMDKNKLSLNYWCRCVVLH